MPAAGAALAVAAGGPGTAGVRAVLGLDVGGTKIAAGVVDRSGDVRSFVVEPTRAGGARGEDLERLFELGRRAVAEAGLALDGLAGVGIGCGGPLDATRGVVSPAHLPEWREVPLVALAEKAYKKPVELDNDATAAAAGEHRVGAGVGTSDMVYLTISTGVGGGVVVGGRLHRGATGNAGELGHITVDWRGRECRGCGRRGCLEAYASGTSIVERAREADLEVASATDVAAAAGRGDATARAVWDETVEALAAGVTSIVNAFEPEVVVLGGGVTRAGEHLFAPVFERVHAEAMTEAGRAVRIVPAALGERVGVVGAAAIVFEREAAAHA